MKGSRRPHVQVKAKDGIEEEIRMSVCAAKENEGNLIYKKKDGIGEEK